MKIVVFAAYFYPHKGGYEKYILELYTRLAARGVDVTIITCKIGDEVIEEKYTDLEILRLDSWQMLGGTYPVPKINKNFFQILKRLKIWSPDLINTQTRFFLTSFIGVLFAKINKKILIHTEHGTGFVKLSNPITNIISRIYDMTLGYLTISLADHTVAISQAAARFTKKMGVKELTIIYNGIDLDKFKKIPNINREIYGLSVNDYVITFIGRVIKAKGLEDLILAFRRLNINNVKLLIVGDGNDYNRIKGLVLNDQNIKLLGEKDEKEIIKILSITDLFVNPSYSEGLPTSVLEAAAIGCDIIATQVGGTEEILAKENLYEPGDKKELVNKIKDKYNNNNKPDYNINKFSWDNITGSINNLYNKLLK